MPNPRPSGPVVLVVDDHADSLELHAVELRLLGFQVVTATSGRSAIAKAAELRPAAVVMDIVMPGMDGCEATRLIRGTHGRLPIVAVTATPSLLAAEERALFAASSPSRAGRKCWPTRYDGFSKGRRPEDQPAAAPSS
jgi:CheY-like chemotaxis protein